MEQIELTELLEKSRERAREVIDLKDGRGVMIYKAPDGNIDIIPFGGDEEMAQPESDIGSTPMELLMSLVLTYLPGSSVQYTGMHNELIGGLRAINTNVTSLFQFLKQAFPGVQLQALKKDEDSGSGLIL